MWAGHNLFQRHFPEILLISHHINNPLPLCGPRCLDHHHYCQRQMTLNTGNISSAETHDSHFYRPTWTHIHTHTERLAENNCSGSSPARLRPPLSPGREHRSRGRHAGVGPLRSGRSLKEACGREGFSGRGSALLEVLDINGKAFSLPRRAAEWLFLYLPLLIPPQRKDNVKETCSREYFQEGTAETTAV